MRAWILALIIFLHGSSMAKGTDPPNGTSNAKPVTLDIKSPNLSTLEKYDHRIHHVKTPSYTAKDGYYMEKIVEGNVEICKGLPRGSFIKVTHPHRKSMFGMVHLYIMEQDGKRSSRYFWKNGRVWNEIGEEDFYVRFHAFSLTKHSFKEKVFSLSGNKNEWELYINESPKSQFAVYGPKSTCRVVKIVTTRYRGSTIWSRKKDEWCTMLSFYPREGDHTLLWIITKDPYEHENILYFAKGGGCGCAWKEVTRETYMDKLIDAGFDGSTFTNEVILDISKPDKEAFLIDDYTADIVAVGGYNVLPGFRISKVVDGNSLIWESKDDKFATHFRLNTRGDKVALGALFTTNTRKEHKLIYYAKNASGSWKVIDKSLYYDILAGRTDPVYTHDVDHPKIIMSSFRNRQGLRIATYASRVDNAKGDIILVHGVRSYFASDFFTFDMDWSYERYGFDIFPHVSIFDKPVEVKIPSNAARYRSYFEYTRLEGMNMMEVLPRFQYRGSFVEALNRLGYNVYCNDYQSHGFSEPRTEKRCHVQAFIDYIYDTLQFVSIVRRGKFEDSSEVWDEKLIYGNHSMDHKLILVGHSLGGNTVIRAVQEFYKVAKDPNTHFVDAIVGLSSMLNIDLYLDTWYKKLVKKLVEFDAKCQPKRQAYFQYPYDIGVAFDRFADYHTDLLYYSNIWTRFTTMAGFAACDEVNKLMAHYPKDLPTFFGHCTNDPGCDIKGPRDFVNVNLNGRKTAKILEFEGDGHHIVASQLVPILVPRLGLWLEEHIPELKRHGDGGLTVSNSLVLTTQPVQGQVHYAQTPTNQPLEVPKNAPYNVAPTPPPTSVPTPPQPSEPSPPTTPIKDARLDITDVDLKVVTMSESFLDGMLVKKTFTPNDGFRITEIYDMNLAIWMSSGQDDYAKSVVVHYDGDIPISVVTYTNLTAGLQVVHQAG